MRFLFVFRSIPRVQRCNRAQKYLLCNTMYTNRVLTTFVRMSLIIIGSSLTRGTFDRRCVSRDNCAYFSGIRAAWILINHCHVINVLMEQSNSYLYNPTFRYIYNATIYCACTVLRCPNIVAGRSRDTNRSHFVINDCRVETNMSVDCEK